MDYESLIKYKHWDRITKFILILSIIVILISFALPYFFTEAANSKRFDFTKTGQIGDTIGGILNPFIALVGVLLTFLAFYMQIKANQLQISQFKISIQNEKKNRLLIEKRDSYNKLNLLKVDLVTIEKDIRSKSDSIKRYYEELKINPLVTVFLERSPTKKYARILEIDRIGIFHGFTMFLNENKDWIKDFSNLYSILDFLPEFFNEIYDKYEYHSKDSYNKKMNIRKELNTLMDELSSIINTYLKEQKGKNYLNFPTTELANNTIKKYYSIIKENLDENGNPTKETDFTRIDNEVLKYFLKETMKNRMKPETYDERIEPIIEHVSLIRKELHLIIQESVMFSENLKSQHEALCIDNSENVSYMNSIIKIRERIESELSKVKLED